MHALTMYSVSMRDNSARTPDNQTGLLKLHDIGLLTHIKNFLLEYSSDYCEISLSKNSVMHVENDWIREDGHYLSGYIEYGHFGVPGKLVNVKTKNKHSKSKDDSDINHLYFCFYIPPDSAHGIALFHKIHNIGAKNVFETEFNYNYRLKHNIYPKLRIRPVTRSSMARNFMEKAQVKKLILERFENQGVFGDIANQLPTGCSFDVIVRAPRGGVLGTLDQFQAKQQDAKFAPNVVLANSLCAKVKSEIQVGDKKRVTELANEGTESRVILTEDEIELRDNFPVFGSIDAFAKQLASDLMDEMVMR